MSDTSLSDACLNSCVKSGLRIKRFAVLVLLLDSRQRYTHTRTHARTHARTHTHTHIHLTALFSGTTRLSRCQKGKTNLDFTEARDSEWQWHPLGQMQVCTLLQTDNHVNIPPLSFLQAGCPSCHPTNSVKALKAIGSDSIERNIRPTHCSFRPNSLRSHRQSRRLLELRYSGLCCGIWIGRHDMLHMHNENTPTNTFKIRVSLQLSVQSQCTHVRATTTAYVNVLFLSC